MRRRVTYLLILLLGSLGAVLGLHFLAMRSTDLANHFNRRFAVNGDLERVRAVDLQGAAYYIAGVSSGHVYLGNEIAQLSAIALDTVFEPVRIVRINTLSGFSYVISSGRLLVDSPFFYLNDQASRLIGRGLIHDWTVRELVSRNIFADLAIPLNSQTLAIRTLDSGGKMQYILGKKALVSNGVSVVPGILENQGDGIFSTDGTMIYDAGTLRLAYIYFYRNQFICLDTNLKVRYRARTIDTNSLAKIKVVEIESDNSYGLATPPRIVNKSGCIAWGKLFIHSLLKADNENTKAFERSSVIDVYDLATGQYRVSFYIPDFERQKIKDFTLMGNQVIAIAGRHLLLYRIGAVLGQLLR